MMSPEKLQEILADHSRWLYGNGGKRADLRDADLRGAVLRDGKFLARAAVQFTAHGECGRELSAIKTDSKESPVTLWCGCFVGSPGELREYIAVSGEKHKRTRTLAMETVLMLLEQTR